MIQNNSFFLKVLFFALSISGYATKVFAQPANDNCSGAIALTVNPGCTPIIGTVANATQSLAGCIGTANDDVWYSFVATQPNLNVQVSGSSTFNTVIQVYSGSCGGLTNMGCTNATGVGLTEISSFSTLTVGNTYFVRVYHLDATVAPDPTFVICVSPPSIMPNCSTSTPAGNTCAQAALICDVSGYCGSTSAAYTSDSWPDLTAAFCGSIENNSFIQFVANSSIVSLNVWVTSSATGGGIQVLIFSATNCSGPVSTYTCLPQLVPSASLNPITATGLTPGATYYMMIDGFAGDVCNYVIGVNSGVEISGQITCPVTNLCLGNQAVLTANGGNGNYTWNNSPTLNTTVGNTVIATPTQAGIQTYTMTTNSNNPGCPPFSVSNFNLNVFLPPAPNAGIDDTVCLGSPIFLNGTQTSSGNTISWQTLTTGIVPTPTVGFAPNFSSLTPTVTVNQPGLYRFILRESNVGCGLARDTVSILVVSPQQTVSIIEPSCFGLSDAEISISNPTAVSYSFDNSVSWQVDSVLTNLAIGNYTVCSKDQLGCTVCSLASITNPAPLGLIVSADTIICENGSAVLSALATSGTSFSYHWNFTTDTLGMQIVSPTSAQEYIVYAENQNGCLSLPDTIQVTLLPQISANISPSIAICPGEIATINATASGGNGGPYSFVWSSGATEIGMTSNQSYSPGSTTTYNLTIDDNCETTPIVLTSQILILPLPVPSFSSVDSIMCEPGSFTLLNETDLTMVDHLFWQISNGQTFTDQEIVSLDSMSAGTYSVQLLVTSPQGCSDSVLITNFLNVLPNPIAEFTYNPNPVTMFSTTVNLVNLSTNGASYQWIIPEGSPSYLQGLNVTTTLPDGETGEYDVMLITESLFGCVDTSIQKIIVLPELLLYVPNSFTPNNDEFNQDWGVQLEGLDTYNYVLLLYNKWGEIIWESRDPSDRWDGTVNGSLVQSGTYIWTIQAKEIYNDAVYNFQGHVSVLR